MLLVPQKKKIIMMIADGLGDKKHEPFVQKLGEESGPFGPKSDSEEGAEDPMEGLVASMESFKSAIEGGSPRAMATALRNFIDICECMPAEEEADEESEGY